MWPKPTGVQRAICFTQRAQNSGSFFYITFLDNKKAAPPSRGWGATLKFNDQRASTDLPFARYDHTILCCPVALKEKSFAVQTELAIL